jgi:N-acetylglucosaminyldiphosphoundecaprenol N-acetyl-beta-D-mannosaminyltransferase
VNVCDGSILAIALTIINRRRFEPYPGPDLFIDYITSHQDCNHFFLGSDGLTLKGLRDYVTALNPHIKASAFLPLPYKSDPRDFDYREIANMVDREQADIIWVSLGAPKQEQFMYYLVRHLRRGVMFGVGAAFSFYSGGPGVRRAPRLLRSLKLEWFYRVCREPNRLTYRFYRELRTMTKLCLRELAKTCLMALWF